MIRNIKQLWSVMLKETKDSAIERVVSEFELTSSRATRQNWIYQEMIPEASQEKVLEIFREELEKQAERINDIEVTAEEL